MLEKLNNILFRYLGDDIIYEGGFFWIFVRPFWWLPDQPQSCRNSGTGIAAKSKEKRQKNFNRPFFRVPKEKTRRKITLKSQSSDTINERRRKKIRILNNRIPDINFSVRLKSPGSLGRKIGRFYRYE